ALIPTSGALRCPHARCPGCHRHHRGRVPRTRRERPVRCRRHDRDPGQEVRQEPRSAPRAGCPPARDADPGREADRARPTRRRLLLRRCRPQRLRLLRPDLLQLPSRRPGRSADVRGPGGVHPSRRQAGHASRRPDVLPRRRQRLPRRDLPGLPERSGHDGQLASAGQQCPGVGGVDEQLVRRDAAL
ncbi:MAG: hypothetical protein AVDCRST_MAG60-576, partial [uncultured Nocardioides sp.]